MTKKRFHVLDMDERKILKIFFVFMIESIILLSKVYDIWIINFNE